MNTKIRIYTGSILMLLTGLSASAQTPVLVKDIRSGSSDSNPEQLTDVDGTLFFVATTGTNGTGTGTELYKSDGTATGTTLVKDIYIGGNADPTNLTNWNGTLYFTATDATHGTELWKSDGTEAGTVLVKDINPSTASSKPANLMVFNNALYFVAEDGTSGYELWKTNGTAEGTAMVTDLYTGPTDAFRGGTAAYQNYCAIMDGHLYFLAQGSSSTGYELWRTDGTAGGTTLVKDIYPGGGDGNPSHLKNINGTLYFWARTTSTGYELWKSDGTTDGTVLVKDIWPDDGVNDSGGWSPSTSTASSTPDFFSLGGNVYFTATEGSTGYELWKTDGTEAGTVQVKDIKPGTDSSFTGRGYTYDHGYSGLTLFNDELYFSAEDGTAQPYHGQELWKTDGTEAGTVMVKDIVAGTGDAAPEFFTTYNNTLLFVAGSSSNSRVIWRTDGTEAGTVAVSGALNPEYLTISDGVLYFSAYSASGDVGYELYKLDLAFLGISEQAAVAAKVYPNPVSDRLYIDGITAVSAALYDMQGRIANAVMQGNSIDVSGYPAGIYMLEIRTEGGSVNHQKFIKQ